MRILVTGATGKVGHAIARALVARGDEVRTLVRNRVRALDSLPDGVQAAEGDVTVPDSLPGAVAGCELVFNAMGLPEQWLSDESLFDRVNAQGSGALARAAREAGVRRFIHTSTEDVFHAAPGARFDETALAKSPKATAYERSKQRAEELVLAERNEMEVVILNPTGVYGPGPAASASLDKDLFAPLVKKRIPALPPGGFSIVYVEGLAQGHVLAAEKGLDGERYILSDAHVTPRELAETVVRVAGRGRVPPTMPVPVARAFAALGEGISRVIRRPPMLARGQLHWFLWDARADSSKAQRELGFTPTPVEEGIRRTLEAMDLLPA